MKKQTKKIPLDHSKWLQVIKKNRIETKSVLRGSIIIPYVP